MKLISRPSLLVLLGAAAVIALALIGPRWLPRLDDASGIAASDLAEQDHLEWRLHVVKQRNEDKRQVIQALLAGELRLCEAAARFRELNDRPEEFPSHFYREVYDGNSDEERLCRQVITWAVSEMEVQAPDKAKALKERLEAELWGYLAGNGLVLPQKPRRADEG